MMIKIRLLLLSFSFAILLPAISYALSIRGTVRCSGEPIARVRIYGSGGAGMTLTSKDGSYIFNVPGPGTYDISPFLYSALVPSPVNRTITISERDINNVDFDLISLENSGLSMVSGRVVDRKGPLVDVTMRLSGVGTQQTDRNGVYYFLNLKSGRYFLSAFNYDNAILPSVREVKLRKERNVKLNFSSLPLAAPGTYTNNFAGLWGISLKTSSNNCQGIPNSLEGEAILSQRGSKVFVQIPRFGSYTVKAGDRSFAGINTFRRSFCTIRSNLEGLFSDDGTRGVLSGSATATCYFASPCSVEFTGGLRRK